MLSALRSIIARIRAAMDWREQDHDFRQELESHVDMLADAKIRRGMPPEQARRAARLEVGAATPLVEAHRRVRGLPLLDTLAGDLRTAKRTLRRETSVSIFAIAMIGLGIGAAATIFAIVNALWLRPLPFAQPDRLVWIANGSSANLSNQAVQVAHILGLREQSRSLVSVEGFSPFYGVGDLRWTGAGEPERLTGVPVTENLFSMLGIRPMLGRFFTADECVNGPPRAVILTHALWQRRFGAKDDVVGTAMNLNGSAATIVGVLPASFDFAGAFSPGTQVDLFVPFALSPESNRRGNLLALIGRMQSGVAVDGARTEIADAVARYLPLAPDVEPGRRPNGFRPAVSPLADRIAGPLRGTLAILAASAVLLMVLVFANVSNLLLVRASSRRQEMAVRTALGASRWDLIRHTLVEGMTLSSAGALLGLAAALAATRLIGSLGHTSVPLLHEVRLGAVEWGFIGLVAVLIGLGFGLLPAARTSHAEAQDDLKSQGRAVAGGNGWMRGVLVVTEIALVCVLLLGASLFARSLLRILDVDLGFSPERLVSVRVDPGREHKGLAARNAYFDRVRQEVGSIPGVEAAGLTDALPLGNNFGWRTWSVRLPDQPTTGPRFAALVRVIDHGYLKTMGIQLRSGRPFTDDDQDTSEPVALVNPALARALWPDQDPLDRTIRTSGVVRRVVGVVDEVHYFGLERTSGPELYLSMRQTADYEVVDLVVRSRTSEAQVIPEIRAALKRVDPQLPLVEFSTMESLVDASVFSRRAVVWLLVGFAAFGLVLAALGLYAVISYSVQSRTRELVIRAALGAEPALVRREVLKTTLGLAAIGLVIGLPAGWLGAQALRGFLFGIAATDPLTYAGVLALVAGVSALAGYIPARRASRVDPALALRSE